LRGFYLCRCEYIGAGQAEEKAGFWCARFGAIRTVSPVNIYSNWDVRASTKDE